ncbi:hypothetical protein PUW79_12520 [Microbacterium sp. NE2HP2]|uniref:hypothetical protein n=1 Tax=Microbacterium TaxID=33882 RepID=UPI0023668909|nr:MULTISPECIES: hypothetical protein [Microbacterium]MDD7945457.1 hypothetical protein [Microbacterium plantarum]WHE36099.1 hypothetical protein P6897_15620 [Microbacterium sp. BDGP8]WRK17382.1 hypothetical protein VC184_16050 [Microbacterium plantarum]
MSTALANQPADRATREASRLQTARTWLPVGSAIALLALIAWAIVAGMSGSPAGIIASTSGAVAVTVAWSTGLVGITARLRQLDEARAS